MEVCIMGASDSLIRAKKYYEIKNSERTSEPEEKSKKDEKSKDENNKDKRKNTT